MPFPKKVLLSAEMSNMLNMLNYFASIWSLLASHRPKNSTYSTYATFQQKEAHFSDTRSNMIQYIQHFSRKKHISNSIGLLSAEMLNMLNFLGGHLLTLKRAPNCRNRAFLQNMARLCRNNVILHYLLTMGLENLAQIWAKSENPFFTINTG